MSRRRLPFSGASNKARTVALTAVAVSVTGLGVAPAQSAVDDSCPAAFPDPITAGLSVHARSVVTGTAPQTFNGTTLGVLRDGIAPGLDMILVRFDSPETDKYGVWEGMSGSPVYSADGRLIGAVSYALASGTTPVAGVTPAAEMQKLLTAVPGSTTAALDPKVTIPPTMARAIVSSGAATGTEVGSGMQELRVPFGVSGMTGTRLRQFSNALGLRNARPMTAGAAGADAPTIPVTAGGNVAASISYGDVTAAGIGTATAVCGSEVLAFGHPMNFSGKSTMTMHGADAIYVQEGPNDASFKVANLGAPVGTVTDDRMAGLRGLVGATPPATTVTSRVAVGAAARVGTTSISVPDAVPDIAIAHVVADQDRLLDALAGGSGSFAWRIDLREKNGTPFTLRRSDVFADPGDISYATVFDLADMLYTLQYGDLGARITSIRTTSDLSPDVNQYTLRKVQLRRHGGWHTLSGYRPLPLRSGTVARLRVVLTSEQVGRRVVRTRLPVPAHAGGKVGVLRVVGGNSSADYTDPGAGFDVFAASSDAALAGPGTPSLEGLAAQLRRTPHHDQVVADLSWSLPSGYPTNHARRRVSAGHVVDGELAFQVRGLPVRH